MTQRSRPLLFSLILLSSTILLPFALNLSSQVIAQTSSQVTVWAADFETGDNSQFNGVVRDTCQNGVIGVTPTIVHSGQYAGYYYGGPSQVAGSSCREYVTAVASVPLTSYYWSGWFYVPTYTPVGWVSFATLGTDTTGHAITLDGSVHQTISVYLANLGGTYNTGQAFPLNQWFQLSVLAHSVDSPNGDVTVYLNGAPIFYQAGTIQGGAMQYMHFGVYKGDTQPTWTVIEDDLILETTSSVTSSSVTTTTSTPTSGSSITVTVKESSPCSYTKGNVQLILKSTLISQKNFQLSCSATKTTLSFTGIRSGTYTVKVTWNNKSQTSTVTVPPNQSVTFLIS